MVLIMEDLARTLLVPILTDLASALQGQSQGNVGQILQQAAPERGRVEQTAPLGLDQTKGVGLPGGQGPGARGHRQGLELDGGLALIGDAITAQPKGGGDGIEQAAGGTGQGGVQPPGHHSIQGRQGLGGQVAGQFQVRIGGCDLLPAQAGGQLGVEVAPGFADGPRPAGQGHRAQLAQALVAPVSGDQELPAPDGAVRPPA